MSNNLMEPVIKKIGINESIKVGNFFSGIKIKPKYVWVTMFPLYDDTEDNEWICETEKNKKAYKKSMEEFNKGNTVNFQKLKKDFYSKFPEYEK